MAVLGAIVERALGLVSQLVLLGMLPFHMKHRVAAAMILAMAFGIG